MAPIEALPDSEAGFAYASVYALATGIALSQSLLAMKERGYELFRSALILGVAVATGIVGAHLIVEVARYLNFEDEGARSSMFGGIVLFAPSLWVLSKLFRVSAEHSFAIAATYSALAMAVGRVGCFLRGCCSGAVLGADITLIASFIDMALFLYLAVRMARTGPDTSILVTFLLVYGLKRYFLGFVRHDWREALLGLSIYQVMGLMMCMAGMTVWWVSRRKGQNTSTECASCIGPPVN